ncbi:MAG: OmpA family protein [Bdellovibrionales bacterium]|nr:OmpA family protein [Bdellovibrionales bacterium]
MLKTLPLVLLVAAVPAFAADPTPMGDAPRAEAVAPIPTESPTTAVPVTEQNTVVGPTDDRSLLGFDPAERLWIYFGLDGGYTSVRPSSGSRESDRDGYAIHLKALLSKYTRNWVGDLGIGYAHHMASGDDQYSPLANATVRVKTRAGFVEFSPRYRFDVHNQLGLVFNGFFGTDVAFDESTSDPNTSFALAGGARYDWETSPAEDHRWRFGLQVLHDLTISNRGIWWIMADVQFGIPLVSDGKPEPAPAPAPSPVAEAPKRPVAPKFAEVTPEKAVKIYLGEAVLRFKTASSELRPSSRQILEKVAKYLNKAPDAWQKMRVEGHADKRGKLDYNMRLSKKRAERVKTELAKLGVPKAKLAAEGFGPTRPIDPADDLEAYALNRRVELWIDGVANPDVLVRDLNELK